MACDALLLAQDGAFNNLTSGQKQTAMFVLLCEILQSLDPMADCDALALAGENPCFNCLAPGQRGTALFNLMCAVLTGVNGLVQFGDASPEGVITGTIYGQLYVQLTGGVVTRLWFFHGTVGENTGWI